MRIRYSIFPFLIIAILITLPACSYDTTPEQSSISTSICSTETTPTSSPIPSEVNTPTLSDVIGTLPEYPEDHAEVLRVSGIMVSPEEAEPLGPYTFCVKDGCIYIPDSLTNTIGLYRDGQLVETWPNTVGNGIAVMAFVGDTLYTISGSNIVEESGILCRWERGKIVDSSIATDRYDGGMLDQVYRIQDRNGEILLQYTASGNFLVSDTGEIKRLNDYSFNMSESRIDIISNDTGIVFSVYGEYEPSGVLPIGHIDGIVYFEYVDTYVTEDGCHRMIRHVFQFGNDGTLINIFPMSQYWDYAPNTEICIDHHHVYQLYSENDQVIVLELSPVPV